MLATNKDITSVYRVSSALVALVITTSIFGLVFGSRGLYDAYTASLAGLVGQDIASLAVGLPVLLWSMRSARRGSVPALLVWAGTLFYFAYSYLFLVLGGFNALFILYVVIVAASLYGLLGLLFALDPEAIRGRFDASTPRRLAGGFLAGTALLFVVMWGGMSAAMIAAGQRPDPVVHLVVAIDGVVLLPALLLGGTKLWRGAAWGYALGGVLLTKATLTGLTLAFTTALGGVWAGTLDSFNAFLLVLFGLMGLIGFGLLLSYLRHVGEGTSRSSAGGAQAHV